MKSYISDNMGKTETNTSYLNDIARIPAGCTLVGNLTCEGDARIDGNIEGNLFSKNKVILGEKATFKGNIYASSIEISGKFDGKTYSEMLVLRSTAVYSGNCYSEKISIDMGALFNAESKMISKEEFAQHKDNFMEGSQK